MNQLDYDLKNARNMEQSYAEQRDRAEANRLKAAADIERLEQEQKKRVEDEAERERRRHEAETGFMPGEDPFAQIDTSEQPPPEQAKPELKMVRDMLSLVYKSEYRNDHPYFNGLKMTWYVCGQEITSYLPRLHLEAHGTDVIPWQGAWDRLDKGGRVTVWVRAEYLNKRDGKQYGNRYYGAAVASDFYRLEIHNDTKTLVFDKAR